MTKMTLFKYRPMTGFDVKLKAGGEYEVTPLAQYASDLLNDGRVYLSDWRNQNDAIEGHYLADNLSTKDIDEIRIEKGLYKICCFSKYGLNPLMWAHYAGGCNGVAFKLEVEVSGNDFLLGVEYMSKKKSMVSTRDDRTSIDILRRKTKDWHYEKEVRLLVKEPEQPSYPVKIKEIYLGHRIDERRQWVLVARANQLGIKCYRIAFDAAGLTLEREEAIAPNHES